MTARRRLVRVPASSANLGPGFDVMAAALSLHMELEVSEDGEFSVDPGVEGVRADRTNLCVRANSALWSCMPPFAAVGDGRRTRVWVQTRPR